MRRDRTSNPMLESKAVGTSSIRAVLFDATGTLFDTAESVGTVYGRIARSYGVDLPAWRLDDAFKRILRSAPPRVFPECDVHQSRILEEQWWSAVVRSTFLATDSTVKFDDAQAFFRELFDYFALADAWTLKAGAYEGIRALKRAGYATGVVSNFDQRLPLILQALGVKELLDVVMIPALCGFEKPHPRIFEAALHRLSAAADTTLFVGDDPDTDRAAAEAVGMRSIAIESLGDLREIAARVEAMNEAGASSTTDRAR